MEKSKNLRNIASLVATSVHKKKFRCLKIYHVEKKHLQFLDISRVTFRRNCCVFRQKKSILESVSSCRVKTITVESRNPFFKIKSMDFIYSEMTNYYSFEHRRQKTVKLLEIIIQKLFEFKMVKSVTYINVNFRLLNRFSLNYRSITFAMIDNYSKF